MLNKHLNSWNAKQTSTRKTFKLQKWKTMIAKQNRWKAKFKQSHNPSTTRQESKNAGSHKEQDIGESKSKESYKATTRMESKNTKFSGFHICWCFIVSSVLVYGFSCISTFMSVCEMTIRWLWNNDNNMMLMRWRWYEEGFSLEFSSPRWLASSIYPFVGFV